MLVDVVTAKTIEARGGEHVKLYVHIFDTSDTHS